ncbi:hypothetical protein [uncultured Cohaesibacter sp.]|uniref:winged helix domain-containing protein n=1 Tax=uncultured Cohaesibacter sp. TaxID=1002546 RepID=UPI00374A1867
MTITVRLSVGGDTKDLTFKGRDAWALNELVNAGAKGCTPINQPAPRWSAYVKKLRDAGIRIETVHESHKGPFPGTHGRYVLTSSITIIKPFDPQCEAA